ncbi:ABC transporter ATP-binding protein [Methanomicrobium antiquum]|uniref:ABC transporter ATP-binding protein n=1 Tax=Methanomicrobium antiquum TaxID=487686 RepID=A0AAF0JNU6_9EURY|nr:ABC transporter ATP-binding protein [Methanomicrobium antiquum]WFN38005.1 ABC transporter ATP-binding protein [Methanomicrobium antiquum]
MISAEDITRTYMMGLVEVRALRGVSVEIKRGDFVGIMGPSGSGKSTLLHILGLLDRPTEGSIRIFGKDVLSMSDDCKGRFRLSKFGFIFQDYALVPELTALENVILPAMAKGLSLAESEKKGMEYLSLVGLGERANHIPAELSGGEQQRVAIARALVNSPEIIFADEPCANLDTENSRAVLELFKKINEETERTVIMVSHESWHKEFFERLILLRDGKVSSDSYL